MPFKPKQSFRKKITLWIVVSSIIPLLILTLSSLLFLYRFQKIGVENQIDDVLGAADNIINEFIEDFDNELEKLITDQEFSKMIEERNRDSLNKTMYSLMGNNSNFMKMHYIDVNGNFAYSTTSTPEFYNLPLYRKWGIFRFADKEKTDELYANVYRDDDGFKNSFSLIKSIYNNSEIQGYVILDVGTEMLQNLLSSVRKTSYGYVEFLITLPNDTIIYNDTRYNTPIHFMENVIPDLEEEKKEGLIKRTKLDDQYELTYYAIISGLGLSTQIQKFTIFTSLGVLIVAFLSTILGSFVSREISDPIVDLAIQIEELDGKNKKINFVNKREDEINYIATQFQKLLDRIEAYHKSDLKKQDLLRLTEMKSLLSQINPHFLYNTLDSIKWKAKLDETDDIAFMVTELSVLLKGSMDTKKTEVTVREELRFIESYINIQKLRYEERFEYILDVQEEVLNEKIPKLILQPIVENALVHGIEPLDRMGLIQVSAWKDSDFLYFSIADNGVGSEIDFAQMLKSNDKEHIGLKNVQKRIQLYNKSDYGVYWETDKDEGTVVFIKLTRD